MKKQYFILLGCTILLSSCVHLSSLQTAKTLPKGDTNLGVAIAAQGYSFDGTYALPNVEIFGRRGIAEDFDIGIKLSSVASISIDGKYKFHDDQASKVAVAVGAIFAFQYAYFPEKYVFTQTLPLYFSYHPNDDFAVHASPKFTHQLVIDDRNSFLLGSNIGLQKRISKRFSLLVEGSCFFTFDNEFEWDDQLFFQIGVGLVFDLR